MAQKSSIRIKSFIELHNWKRMPVSGMRLETSPICHCCGGSLASACTLKDDTHKVRIGVCPRCGYKGYIDKPERGWLETYYDDTWDTASKRTVEDIEPRGAGVCVKKIVNDDLPKDATLFEVGVGYGQSMKALTDEGYENMSGIENSKHRADLAAKYTGKKVYHGAFGSDEVREVLKDLTDVSAIYSNSVLEHVYDPNEFFAQASRMQKEGGRLYIVTPNVHREPTINTLMFFPHLHGFTEVALRSLALKHGYVITYIEHKKNFLCVAEKRENANDKGIADNKDLIEKWREEFFSGAGTKEYPTYYWYNIRGNAHHGHVLKGRTKFMYTLTKAIFSLVLPSKTLLRIIFKVPKEHRMMEVHVDKEHVSEGSLQITMDELTLLYK